MFVSLILGIVILVVIIGSYIYRQVNYKNWLKTDEGILQSNLEKLRKDPKDLDALKVATHLLYQKKQYEKAYPHFSKLAIMASQEATPPLVTPTEQFKIYLEFGISAYKIKKYEEALIVLKKARLLSPRSKHLGLALTLGHLLFRRELYNEAAKELRAAYTKDSSNPNLMFYLGVCREKLGEYGNALSLLKPIEGKFRKNPQFLQALAHCHAKTNDSNSAIKLYKSLLSYPNMAADAAYELSQLYRKAKNTNQAIEYLEQIPKLEQPTGELTYQALYETAQLYAKLGKLHEACVPLQKLYQLNPLYLETKSLLRNYKEMLKNYNLYILYYGDQTKKQRLLSNIIQFFVVGLWKVDNTEINVDSLEATAYATSQQEERNYYIWINLKNGIISQDKMHSLIARGKQYACTSYILITIDSFDSKVKEFCRARPMELIEGPEFREHLLTLGENAKTVKED